MQTAIWLWNGVTDKWEKAQSASIPVRRVAVGAFIPGAHKLCWVACDPSAGLSLWEITDAIAGGSPVILSCYSTARESKIGAFTPPINFKTGIYLETFTNMTAITIGYI